MKKILKIGIQKIKNYLWHLPKSIYFDYRYAHPSRSLVLIGITGTDGKTTTSTLIYHILRENGINAGLISTLGARYADKIIDTGFHTTSPDPAVVQPLFREMVDSGVTHAVIEVTAHALDQYRFQGCRFRIAGLTNTSHEHLDDFLHLDHYILTKARLFANADITVLNRDDPSFKIISPLVKKPVTFGTSAAARYRYTTPQISSGRLKFSINGHKIDSDSPFAYQAGNITLAFAICDQLKIDTQTVTKVVTNFPEIKGRRENVNNSHQLHCIVDFAHTPAALKETLSSLRQQTPGKLIVIFGATGGRDPSKRPLMGRTVAELADTAIVTADDTRNEKIEDINRLIIEGITSATTHPGFKYYDIPNRQEAFNQAVKLAKKGDTIIACGKGHETTILHGQTEYPWSESEAFRTALKQRYGQI